jgi:predicted GNAT family N-acyltransferase
MIQVKQVTSTHEITLAQQIRRQVFVEEQGIPAALEYDDADATAIHVLAYRDEVAVGTGRLLIEANGFGTLGRIAVLSTERGNGIGGQVVQALEECALRARVRHLVLHPHFYLERFYRNLGYCTIPASDSTVGQHRLIAMEKWLGAGRQEDKKTGWGR